MLRKPGQHPDQPSPVAKQHHGNQTEPSDPYDIKHILCQTLRCKVFTGALQCFGGRVERWPARSLEDEFGDEGGDREDEVGEERAPFPEEVEEDEEGVDSQGADVKVIEGGDVGFRDAFLCLLRHINGGLYVQKVSMDELYSRSWTRW